MYYGGVIVGQRICLVCNRFNATAMSCAVRIKQIIRSAQIAEPADEGESNIPLSMNVAAQRWSTRTHPELTGVPTGIFSSTYVVKLT